MLIRQGELVKSVLSVIADGKPEDRPFATLPIENIRHALGVNSFSDAMNKSEDEFFLELRILKLFGYTTNKFSQGFWVIPPGKICVADWENLHGQCPEIKTDVPVGCSFSDSNPSWSLPRICSARILRR